MVCFHSKGHRNELGRKLVWGEAPPGAAAGAVRALVKDSMGVQMLKSIPP